MEAFREKLAQAFEQAELFSLKEESVSLEIRNGVLKEISTGGVCGKSLRVVKKGKSGSNFTMGDSPGNMERLIAGAGQSAEFGRKAGFSFSRGRVEPGAGEEDVPERSLVDYAAGFLSFMGKLAPSAPLNVNIIKSFRTLSVATTCGGFCADSEFLYSLHFSSPVPGGSSEVSRSIYSRKFFDGFPEEDARDFIMDYNNSRAVSPPPSGRLPVLFAPGALFVFVFCLQEGVSGKNLHLKISPLAEKKGEKLFSEKINLSDEPGKTGSPHARRFDDEGVKTAGKEVVRDGMLKNFIYDLDCGAKLGEKSTGNGLRASLFSAGAGTPVSPSFINPVIKPGLADKEDMVRGIKEGVIVENVIGFHSSNYTQGHFSVQAQGFHVSGGKVKGRLEDVMISGNIYEDFKNVPAVGRRLYCASYGYAPYMLVENINVSGG